MVKSFILENIDNKTSMSFGQTISSDCLYKDDGVDWGNAPAAHSTFSYPTQLGEYISSTAIKGRSVSIMGFVFYIPTEGEKASMTSSELIEYCEKKMMKKKSILNTIVNPTQNVRLTIGDYYIEGKPSSSIRYGSNVQDNNEYFCSFSISIYCNNPMFRKSTLPKTVLNGMNGAFHFPLVFPKNKGIIMGIRSSYKLIAIENEGNVSTGCIIRLKATGTIKNPTITNVDTGEFITINKTMVEGEVIEINTNDGSEKGVKGYIGDQEMNYFMYWDFDSSWLKFPIGTSLVGYSIYSGDTSSLEISIVLNPLKYALEDM